MTEARASCGPVLIADDDAILLALIEVSLVEAGFGTVCAVSGEEAHRIAAAQPIGAAVLDVNLPEGSGYEVCRRLRQLHGFAIPILFISGERTEGYDRVAGLLIGADDYLVKPFDPGELVARVDGLIRRAHVRGAVRRLTPRELEVLTLLAEGLDQTEIAERLQITSKTVATHLERILGKLGARSRAQAVAMAYREAFVAVSA